MPQILLMSSVVSCGGSTVEPAGTNCDQDGAAPDLLSERSHVQPPWYQTCAFYTNYNLKKYLVVLLKQKKISFVATF